MFALSLFKLNVFLLKFSNPPDLTLFHAPVTLAPLVECDIRDPLGAAYVSHAQFTLLRFPQYLNNLFFCSALDAHYQVLSKARLSLLVD